MKQLIYYPIFLLLAALVIVACNDDSGKVDKDPEPVIETGKVILKFDNVVGDQDLNLDTTTYVNSIGEDFTVSRFNYFISNIRLFKENGDIYTVPQDSSYFRIAESDPKSQIVTLKNIPKASYTAIEYLIGVDSLRSVSGIEKRKGVLDPSGDPEGDGMYWAWNSGYIFLKLEGSSSKANNASKLFFYHIGFFGGFSSKTANNLKTVKIDFKGSQVSVGGNNIPKIRLVADVQKIFKGPWEFSFQERSSIMLDSLQSTRMANNYKSMFSLGEIRQDSEPK